MGRTKTLARMIGVAVVVGAAASAYAQDYTCTTYGVGALLDGRPAGAQVLPLSVTSFATGLNGMDTNLTVALPSSSRTTESR